MSQSITTVSTSSSSTNMTKINSPVKMITPEVECMLLSKKEEIRTSVTSLLREKGRDMNYVNKRLQDSIVNFFLEDYITPVFDTEELHTQKQFVSRKSLHKQILKCVEESKEIPSGSLTITLPAISSATNVTGTNCCSSSLSLPVLSATTAPTGIAKDKQPKYMLLLNEYLERITREGLFNAYVKILVRTILRDDEVTRGTGQMIIWRKQLCVLLFEHAFNRALTNIYLMWNAAYPEHPIYNKKESFYRKNIKSHFLNDAGYFPKPMKPKIRIPSIRMREARIAMIPEQECVPSVRSTQKSKDTLIEEQAIYLIPTDQTSMYSSVESMSYRAEAHYESVVVKPIFAPNFEIIHSTGNSHAYLYRSVLEIQ